LTVLEGSSVSIFTALASSAALKALDKEGMAGPVKADDTQRHNFLSSAAVTMVLLTVQHSLGPSLHGDDVGWPGYFELEVGIARDGHEVYVTWLPQYDVVRHGEVDHLESTLCLD
jgi:hypothetical protein